MERIKRGIEMKPKYKHVRTYINVKRSTLNKLKYYFPKKRGESWADYFERIATGFFCG